MSFFFLPGIYVYRFGIFIASFFSEKARLWIRGRKNTFSRLSEFAQRKDPTKKLIWFHCASLGEFEQGRPLIEKFFNEGAYTVALSFFSPSGFEVRKNYEKAHFVFYLPLDTPGNAAKTVSFLRPDLVIFVKYEFWHFHLREISKNKIPLLLISGVFHSGQPFFKFWGKGFRKTLSFFSKIGVRDERSQLLLKTINVSSEITGDLRFDRVSSVAGQAFEDDKIRKFSEGQKILVAGSAWEPDDAIILKFLNSHAADWKIILAPHDVNPARIDLLKRTFGTFSPVLYSGSEKETDPASRVMIIDTIGKLSFLYRYGSLCWIGGGFGKSIHNILEPAAYGIPVVFGPAFGKFPEAGELITLGGAFGVNTPKEGFEKLSWLARDPVLRQIAGFIGSEYVRKNTGATEKSLQLALSLINNTRTIPAKTEV
jgi:3-deoxy-D-manno-octulosonic-acid transferase